MNVLLPRTLAEALDMMSRNPGAVIAAGTTDLLPRWHSSAVPVPEDVVLLTGIPGLAVMARTGAGIEIGACATHAAISSSDLVRRHLPALAEAAESVGAPAVRNAGTIGGNVANASPAADLPPALLVHDASVRLVSPAGERLVRMDRFFLGYATPDIGPGELVSAIVIPVPAKGSWSRFVKVGTRRAQSIAKVSVAGFAEPVPGGAGSRVRLAAGSVAPVPRRLGAAEDASSGRPLGPGVAREAALAAMAEVSPIDDVRSTAAYRRHVVGVLVERFLREAYGRNR